MDQAQFWFQDGPGGGGGNDPGDPIGQSLRFRGAQSLTRTPGTAGNRRTWTYSVWVKNAEFVANTVQTLFTAWEVANDEAYRTGLIWETRSTQFNSVANLSAYNINNHTTGPQKLLSRVCRDYSAWYHIVWVADTTNATAADRMRFFINGVRQDNFANNVNGNEDVLTWINSTGVHSIGRTPSTPAVPYEGYMADIYLIDGQALEPTDFGRFNANGVWVPVDYSGTYGTNGFHLDFADPDDLGADRSGNGNDFTATGFNTAPVGIFSDDLVSSSGGFQGHAPATGMFDGDLNVSCQTSVQGATVTWTPSTPINFNSTVEMYTTGDSTSGASVNGGDPVTRVPSGFGWVTIASGGGTINEVVFGGPNATPGNYGGTVRAIRLDGTTILVDNTGVDYDLMQDSPTQNYATGNPLMHGIDGGTRIMSYTKANLGFLDGGPSSLPWTHPSIRVPMDVRAYAEFTNIVGAITAACGVSERRPTTDGGWGSNGCWSWALDTRVWIVKPDGSTDTVNVPGRWTGTAGDVAGVEVNTTVTPPTVTFTLNGANASTHTFNADFDPENIWIGGNFGANTVVQNFGQQPFQHQPTGTIALQTNNLPEPEIKNGSDHFQAITDTGANILTAAQTAFPNGLWWIKDRVNSNQHQLVDSIRGQVGGNWQANLCPAVGADVDYVAPAGNSVAWCWSAPEAFTDNSGAVPATGFRNVDAGFSLITWEGLTAGNSSVAHGLGRPVDFVIARAWTRSGRRNLRVYVRGGMTLPGSLYLNESITQTNEPCFWQDPDDTLLYLGDELIDTLTPNGIAYAWASIPGYSAFGSYTGNGSADGPFIYTGFRPAFVMVKRATGGVGNWQIMDSTINPSNPANIWIEPNEPTGEQTGNSFIQEDFLSNGFKPRGGASQQDNLSGETYIYCCFAENPFQAPVTAR